MNVNGFLLPGYDVKDYVVRVARPWLSGGVGINHLSAAKFSKLPVMLPPVVEQLALIETLEESFSRIDDQRAFQAHSLKQSTAQRQNVLRAAFSGQLVPQDPSDEPASVLLEHIRAERLEQAAGRNKKHLAARTERKPKC